MLHVAVIVTATTLAAKSLADAGASHTGPVMAISLAALFAVSFISNATPFFGAAYTLIATAELIVLGFSLESFLLVVLITASGAAAAKLVIYAGAKWFSGTLKKNKNVKILATWLRRRSFLVVVFVTAVIPALPLDDYIYLGAGAANSRLLPMFSVTLLAKIVKSAVEIGLEFFGILRITNLLPSILHITSFEFSLLLSVVFVLLGIFLFKFDWEKIIKRVTRPPKDEHGSETTHKTNNA